MPTNTVAILLGDRHGVGPEVAARSVAQLAERYRDTRFLLVGASETWAAGIKTSASAIDPIVIDDASVLAGTNFQGVGWLRTPSIADEGVAGARVSPRAGEEVLGHLALLARPIADGAIDGVVFAPVNKQALRLGGLATGDTIDFLAQKWGSEGSLREMSVTGGLWTARVTSHVPLARVSSLVTTRSVAETIATTDATLKQFGIERPRIAVTGLNPHAGDGGAIGREEIDEIAPAVASSRQSGIDVQGPMPVDTAFLANIRTGYDAIVCMYHDQSQLALKLMDFAGGASLLTGLPVPVTTPMHGTAFPIVGQGVADHRAMSEAIDLCTRIAAGRAERPRDN